MKLNAKEIFKPTLVLVIICLVVTACLAGTNAATKTAVEKQQEEDTKESQQTVLPAAKTFEQAKGSETCFVGKDGSNVVGYVVTTTASSYGGQIQVMTGIDKNGTITGVNLLSTSDTPGLGLNAQKESFRDQYKQKAPSKGFDVVKGGGAKQGQINAITGATITSKAVTKAVNEAITEYEKVKGGE